MALTPPPLGLELASRHIGDADVVAAADHAARHWQADARATISPGSDAHRDAVCRMFRDTFNPYKPSVIDWPQLDPEARERLTSLPIWDIAVQTEGKARLRDAELCRQSLHDAAWREAIELNGWEEGRHKEVLANLVAGLRHRAGARAARTCRAARSRMGLPGHRASASASTASSPSACSRWRGGRASFPPELVDTFEPVIQEEGRHILLFANWVAWHRRRLPWWRRPWFEAAGRCGLGVPGLGAHRHRARRWTAARAGAGQQLHAHRQQGGQRRRYRPGRPHGICLQENDRRFAGYDLRLLRPTTTPALTRFALRFMRRKRTPAPAA